MAVIVPTVRLVEGGVRIIDQTLLPDRKVFRTVRTVEGMVEAIRSLRVRGAPAIGVAAAMMLAVEARRLVRRGVGVGALRRGWERAVKALDASRPTAVNLFVATRRMDAVFRARLSEGGVVLAEALEREARAILEEDLEMSRRIGRAGAPLVRDGSVWLTHCNAGGLATGGLGTALAVFYEAKRLGRRFEVWVDETRPLLQGARLTAWELREAGLPVTLIVDGMAAYAMARGRISGVLVGADRICRNGDAANKIGTLGVAVAARRFGVPFHVAAPSTTFDPSLPDGRSIPIEERDPAEVTSCGGRRTAPAGVRAWNPAFDVTPAELVTAFVTDRGLLRPPYRRSLAVLARPN